MQAIDLTEAQRTAIRSVFAQRAGHVDRIGVFGSRAEGRARRGSDVDLVIYGHVSAEDIGRFRLGLEESGLSVFADLVAYQDLQAGPLRDEIDRTMKPLFDKHDLYE
jgi:uncharacterized protein